MITMKDETILHKMGFTGVKELGHNRVTQWTKHDIIVDDIIPCTQSYYQIRWKENKRYMTKNKREFYKVLKQVLKEYE